MLKYNSLRHLATQKLLALFNALRWFKGIFRKDLKNMKTYIETRFQYHSSVWAVMWLGSDCLLKVV